jgi:hypothetical protein
VAIYKTTKPELGYPANGFLQMLGEHGGVATAKQLLWSDKPHRRIHLSVGNIAG